MSAEMWSGDMTDFEAAAERCPFLNSLGESALADIRSELEATSLATKPVEQVLAEATTQEVDVKVAEPRVEHASSRQKPERVTAEAKKDGSVQAIVIEDIAANPEPPRLERTKPSREKVDSVLLATATDSIKGPVESIPVVQQPLTAEFAHRAAYAAEEEPQIAERLHMQLKESAVPAAPQLIPVPEAIKYGAGSPEMSAAPEQGLVDDETGKRAPELAVPSLDIRMVDSAAESDEMLPVQVSLPRTVEELLTELEPAEITPAAPVETEAAVSGVEDQGGAVTPEAEPAFSVRLEALVAETVPEERQQTTRVLIAKAYELAEMLAEPQAPTEREAAVIEPESDTQAIPDTEDVFEAGPGTEEIPGMVELEHVVALLLQELSGAEPKPEQIKRFISLVSRQLQHTAQAGSQRPVHDIFGEILSGLAAPTSYIPMLNVQILQLLGRVGLVQPQMVWQ